MVPEEQPAPPPAFASPQSAFQSQTEEALESSTPAHSKSEMTDVYLYGIGRGKAEQTIQALGLPFRIVDDVRGADVLLTTRQMYRRRAPPIYLAEEARVPVHVLRRNTPFQLEQALATIATANGAGDAVESALEETENALQRILSGQAEQIELTPQNAYVRRLQHELAQQYSLHSHSSGREPNRRVRLFRDPGSAGAAR